MRHSISEWWSGQTKGQKGLFIIAGVVMAAAVIAGLIGIFLPDGTDRPAASKQDTSAQTTEKPQTGEQPDQDPSEGTGQPEQRGAYPVSLDQNGMALFPETTDPREAAAHAAAVFWNLDPTKVTREEFFQTAIERVTQPSEKYVGPNGEVHTFWAEPAFKEPTYEFFEPSRVLTGVVEMCGVREPNSNNPCTWWEYANAFTFEGLAHEGLATKAEPVRVYSADEIDKLAPGVREEIPERADVTPDTEGATYTEWFVLTDLHMNDSPDAPVAGSTAVPRGAHFFIWCDAPKDGGLCGVGSSNYNQQFPVRWPSE